MDIARSPEHKARTRRRRFAAVAALVVIGLATTYAVGRLKPGAPVVDRAGLWIDKVARGTMVREVRGAGQLVPDEFIWIAAEAEGRVDRVFLRAGARVAHDTVVLKLSNPEVEQAAVTADLALQSARAAYRSLESSLRNDLLQQRSVAAAVEADQAQAAMQAAVDTSLAHDGLLAELTSKQSTVRAASLSTRLKLEQERLATSESSIAARLAVQAAEVDSRRAVADLRHRDVAALTVRAGMAGVLQEVTVDEGQRVARSANLARVADPTRLKAELRIPETQTRDLSLGLPASIDTHNGVIAGRISRIDPAAQNGTVTVDVALQGALPSGARPDMTIDGAIELQRLENALYVGRPALGREQGTVTLFKLDADGARAVRTSVRIGRTSAASVEVLGGLAAGDQVVLSDTSAWDGQNVIALR